VVVADQLRRAILVVRLFAGALSLMLAAALLAGLALFRDRNPASLILGSTLALVYGIGGLIFLGGIFRRLVRGLELRMREAAPEPIYGFLSLLVAGLGSTMGISMLTVLPYAIRSSSVASTLAAIAVSGAISLLLAQAYGTMGRLLSSRGERSVGGPAFVKSAYGPGASYFLSRLSMWVGTTALTAFNLVMSVKFLAFYLPEVLSTLGFWGEGAELMIMGIGGAVLLWAALLFKYEGTHRKEVTAVQAVLISTFLALLFISLSSFLRHSPHPPIDVLAESGIALRDVVFNAGYIYLVLFGFQEVQALFEESRPEISIPLVGMVPRERYVGWVMMLTVALSTLIFAAYSIVISPFDLSGDIPPLEISFGIGETAVLVNSALVLLAAVTTLTPSYMAAKRHLEELGRDGLIPQSITRHSWMFTLAMALIMGLLETNTLVGIADVGILLSLALISLADFQLRRGTIGPLGTIRDLTVSAACLIVLTAYYLIEPQTFILGIMFLVLNWFIFSVFRLGVGVNLFMATLTLTTYVVIERVQLAQAFLGVWVTKRLGTVLLLLAAAYLVQALVGLRLRDVWYDFLRLAGRGLRSLEGAFTPVVSSLREELERTSLEGRRYQIIEAAIKVEQLRETNPELYRRIEPIVRRDLERLLRYELERGAD